MRVIHKASLVFKLKDLYSKAPVINAVILCNGKQNPYTRKDDGYYVFSNLYPGNYTINISCKGYIDMEFSVALQENETRVTEFYLPYAMDNVNFSRITRFEITLFHRKEFVKNEDISIILKNEYKILKLLEPVEQSGDFLKLNIEELVSNIIGQKFLYVVDNKEFELEIFGYDAEKKCYILKDNVSEKIEPNGVFYPMWNLKTNADGKILIPFMPQFMKDSNLNFEFKTSNAKSHISFDIGGKVSSGEAFIGSVNLRKFPKKNKEENS
ncbi:MAG: carboxypeptidase-like regulatory domain-containing protein [Clostridia bacterium]|nr:carboxypeptidase-like regulatory domain-containing protein [Clostridia bacterium]